MAVSRFDKLQKKREPAFLKKNNFNSPGGLSLPLNYYYQLCGCITHCKSWYHVHPSCCIHFFLQQYDRVSFLYKHDMIMFEGVFMSFVCLHLALCLIGDGDSFPEDGDDQAMSEELET